jgi:hypothetical protein
MLQRRREEHVEHASTESKYRRGSCPIAAEPEWTTEQAAVSLGRKAPESVASHIRHRLDRTFFAKKKALDY